LIRGSSAINGIYERLRLDLVLLSCSLFNLAEWILKLSNRYSSPWDSTDSLTSVRLCVSLRCSRIRLESFIPYELSDFVL